MSDQPFVVVFQRHQERTVELLAHHHPHRVFPTKIDFSDSAHRILGYASLLDSTSADEICEWAIQQAWDNLLRINGQFLLIVFNKGSGDIHLVSDQSGAFPCCFAIGQSSIAVSTHIGSLRQFLEVETLNIDGVLDSITNSLMISTDTLLNEINQAPPGYVIHIDPAGEWEVKGDPRRLLINASGRPQARRQQDETILEIIDQLILNDLEALRSRYGIDIFGAHLSAGLDSSLISYLLKRELGNSLRCYSLMSELASSADNPHLIERFSNAHGIITTFVDVTNEYPLGTEEDRERTVAYPRFLNPLRNLTKRVNTEIASQEVVAVFTGIGGNEAYRTDRVPLMSRFFQQEHFFFEVDAIRSQLASCLTGAAVEAILSPRRFCSRRVYPMLLAESVVRSNLVEFESYWSSGVWPVQTFTNTELLRVIRDNASGMAIASREYILKRLAGEVFLDEQFEAIGNYNAHYALMFEREFALIEDLLRNPVLDRLGLVTGDSLRRFALGDYREALVEDGSIVMLHNIVRLELFLQRNDALRLVP